MSERGSDPPGNGAPPEKPADDAAPAPSSSEKPSGSGKKKPKQWPPPGEEKPTAEEKPSTEDQPAQAKKKPKKWVPPGEEKAASGAEGAPAKKKPKKFVPPDKAAEKGGGEKPPPDKPPWQVDPTSPEWEDVEGDPLVDALREAFGDGVLRARRFAGDLYVDVAREAVQEIGQALKMEHGFTLLVDVCGAHHPKREDGPAFDVVYNLYDLGNERRLLLKVGTDEDQPVPSVAEVWRGANWPEREIYDMYGVTFEGHPDMTRILLWEGFNGFPLRKDFPVEGIDTGSAIYPEYYQESAGPVTGTGTGWRPPDPPEEPAAEPPDEGA